MTVYPTDMREQEYCKSGISQLSTVDMRKSCVLAASLLQRVLIIQCNTEKTEAHSSFYESLANQLLDRQPWQQKRKKIKGSLHPDHQILVNCYHQSMMYSRNYFVIKYYYYFFVCLFVYLFPSACHLYSRWSVISYIRIYSIEAIIFENKQI